MTKAKPVCNTNPKDLKRLLENYFFYSKDDVEDGDLSDEELVESIVQYHKDTLKKETQMKTKKLEKMCKGKKRIFDTQEVEKAVDKFTDEEMANQPIGMTKKHKKSWNEAKLTCDAVARKLERYVRNRKGVKLVCVVATGGPPNGEQRELEVSLNNGQEFRLLITEVSSFERR